MLRDYPWPAVDVRDELGDDYNYKFDCEVVRTEEGWRPVSTAVPVTEGTLQRKENTDSYSRYIASTSPLHYYFFTTLSKNNFWFFCQFLLLYQLLNTFDI